MQTVLLGVSLYRLNVLEDRLEALAGSAEQASDAGPDLTRGTGSVAANPANGIDSRQLRQIVREEMLAALASDDRADQGASNETGEPVYDDVEMQLRQEWIFAQMDLLKGRNSVSTMEIDRVFGAIARLDPERRTAMMREMNRAINQGEIKGNL